MIDAAADTNIRLARGLFASAHGFFKAADAINRIDEAGHRPAFLVNACYAIELASKAFLAHRGGSERRLRQTDHDLVGGLNAAKLVGYEPTDDRIARLAAMLNPHHRGQSVRYLIGEETMATPEPDEILAVIGLHLVGIGEQMAKAG